MNSSSVLEILDRGQPLFTEDLRSVERELEDRVRRSSFLVIGGGGSIGQSVVKEIFARGPRRLHVVDISENNLVELVRDIRSSLGYIEGDFQALPLDCGSKIFSAFLNAQPPYDYILNLSALKHVRSEKDPYTLMRMISVNVLNTEMILQYAIESGCTKYFGVSTDKAVRPANAMGATKSVMEMCMLQASRKVTTSSARFANVAFSDGSLLHGFTQRVLKRQPLAAPSDVKRYFISAQESGVLCLLSCLLGENRDLLFPKEQGDFRLIGFRGIAERYLRSIGFEAYPCATEDEARSRVAELAAKRQWPCYFFETDTAGEKSTEEFFATGETLDLERFDAIGVVKQEVGESDEHSRRFLSGVRALLEKGNWSRNELLELLRRAVPSFEHKEAEKFLDQRM